MVARFKTEISISSLLKCGSMSQQFHWIILCVLDEFVWCWYSFVLWMIFTVGGILSFSVYRLWFVFCRLLEVFWFKFIADSISSSSSVSMYSSVSNLFSALIIGLCFEEDLGFMSSVLVKFFFCLGLFLRLVLFCSLLGFSLWYFLCYFVWVRFFSSMVVWECSVLRRAVVFVGVFVFFDCFVLASPMESLFLSAPVT